MALPHKIITNYLLKELGEICCSVEEERANWVTLSLFQCKLKKQPSALL